MKSLIVLIGCMVLASGIYAQNIVDAKHLVQYDPLFWKDKLKLDEEQCQKIKEINGEYYESLTTAYEEVKDDRNALRVIADKSLVQRNQEIWETFYPKQRKRWKRIWNENHSNES